MFVFPMGGRSSRFTAAGYTKPKFMLKLGDHTVFQYAIAGFRRYFASEVFCFIYVDGQADPVFIRNQCLQSGLPHERIAIVALPAPTDGQARTVVDGLRLLGTSKDEPLTIFNIDTFYSDFRHPNFPTDAPTDGYLDVFVSDGSHWSFVEPAAEVGDIGVARRVAEKLRISDLCSTGLYNFRSAEKLYDAFDAVAHVPAHALQGGERYIAPLYQSMIDHGCTIRYRIVPREQISFCGTPAEYEQFVSTTGLSGEAPSRIAH